MLTFNLVVGCGGFILSGNALTRFVDTKDARWATTGIVEILISSYFVIAALSAASL